MTTETHSFQTEVQQLLDLMVHSLYSNRDIFLRELISNSSDALDRLRFEELTNRDLVPSPRDPAVRVKADRSSRTLIIEDNGIGMTHEELIANLGTIASSGTKRFLKSLKEEERSNANLIGQFGVGFYSAFMVADKVRVETRSARGERAWVWESRGDGKYTIEEGARDERGTRVELTLKVGEDFERYLEEWTIRSIVTKYSDYVTYPIFLLKKPESDDAEKPVTAEGEAEIRLNKTTPVWAKSKKDNKPEDYHELYKQIARDFQDPLMYEHISVEGLTPFQSVIFVPAAAPFDLYTRDSFGLHLYVKRVSITDKCKELLPEYLRFLAGVVETEELPLNVSREILQQNNRIPVIRKQVVKKTLSMLQNAAQNDQEKFLKFWEVFGPVFKEGFHYDYENHETLAEIVRFRSSKTGANGWVSLKEYVERFAANQKSIYFITAPSYEVASRSPHVEALVARDIEVLFLTDPIDEWVVLDFQKYKDHELKSISKGDLDLSGVGKEPESQQREEPPAGELATLVSELRTRLEADVKDVKVSSRLTDSACCLVADEHGMSSHMEKLLKLSNKEYKESKKILEINPRHPLIRNLASLQTRGEQGQEFQEWVNMLYDTALLAEGSPIRDPGEFARRVTRMMEMASKGQG